MIQKGILCFFFKVRRQVSAAVIARGNEFQSLSALYRKGRDLRPIDKLEY